MKRLRQLTLGRPASKPFILIKPGTNCKIKAELVACQAEAEMEPIPATDPVRLDTGTDFRPAGLPVDRSRAVHR